jgi:hypothetical protein
MFEEQAKPSTEDEVDDMMMMIMTTTLVTSTTNGNQGSTRAFGRVAMTWCTEHQPGTNTLSRYHHGLEYQSRFHNHFYYQPDFRFGGTRQHDHDR